jgi:hypothetical protein
VTFADDEAVSMPSGPTLGQRLASRALCSTNLTFAHGPCDIDTDPHANNNPVVTNKKATTPTTRRHTHHKKIWFSPAPALQKRRVWEVLTRREAFSIP